VHRRSQARLSRLRRKGANGITTVHLAYAREGTGHALIAARQSIPREQIQDPAMAKTIRLPEATRVSCTPRYVCPWAGRPGLWAW
jgi:hypothetical protein